MSHTHWRGEPWRVLEELADEDRRRVVRDRRSIREPRKEPTMVIITWKQRPSGGRLNIGDAYTMRAVVKPINTRTAPPFVIEREHVDATGGRGWIPADHEHAMTIVCKALLQLADSPEPSSGLSKPPLLLLSIDLGVLDLPES